MKTVPSLGALLALLALSLPGAAGAHCQVPCGIFTDSLRFDAMLEDTQTIRKAMGQIRALAGKADAGSVNQTVRWVHTKEEHASRIQEVIADYFMAQRIKPDQPGYAKRLAASHAVMQAAMRCRQTTEEAGVAALEKAIRSFREAYAPDVAAPDHRHEPAP